MTAMAAPSKPAITLTPETSRIRVSAVGSGILIGYARCSTEHQDLTAQREILRELGVAEDRIYLDHGMTGRNRSRPGLNSALAAVSEGETLVVPKLERLARSVPHARAIGDSLARRGVRLSLGGSVYDPNDPMGKCFFNILATFAEFEVDLLRMRTCEGIAIARAKGRLKGKPPQRAVLLKLHLAGDHTIAELAELFSVSRQDLSRASSRHYEVKSQHFRYYSRPLSDPLWDALGPPDKMPSRTRPPCGQLPGTSPERRVVSPKQARDADGRPVANRQMRVSHRRSPMGRMRPPAAAVSRAGPGVHLVANAEAGRCRALLTNALVRAGAD